MQGPGPIYINIAVLRPGTVGAYVFAVLCAGIAAALRMAIDPYVVGVQFITFFPAVIITTLISGFGAGLFCVVLSVAAAAFFVMPPRSSFYIDHPGEVLALMLFVLVALSNVVLVAGMRYAVEGYQKLSQDLEQSEKHLHVLVGELQHRTRNLISVVGAIANQTLLTSETFDEFKAIFQDRLGVLARVQGLLFRMKEDERVTFDELLDSELSAKSAYMGSVTLDGPKGIRLRSGSIQILALALHELVTNAVKYGALKQPNGHLTVRWWVETSEESGKPWLHLDWKESGVEVPPLCAGTGHGRELIERALPYQFDAQTTFVLDADGVHCPPALPASEHRLSAL
jgi:two-component sensor histidine kinase